MIQPVILIPKTFGGRRPPTYPGCPLKILFDHPGRSDVTSWGRLEMTSRGRLNLTFKGRP